jgi:glycosyltransferase involved in cell wall biosynthesis
MRERTTLEEGGGGAAQEPRPSLMLVINSLDGGGAERVLALLAREFAASGRFRDVLFVTLDDTEDRYPLDPAVRRIPLDTGGSLPRGFLALRRVVLSERPDVVLSFLTRANVAAALVGRLTGTPVVVSERVNTSSHLAGRRDAAVTKALVRFVYPLARHVVCVSDGVRRDLVRNFAVPAARLSVIHNPVDRDRIAAAARAEPEIALPRDYFVAVGRLVPNKGFDRLVRAVAALPPGPALVILGEGPERDRLQAMIDRFGLSGRVFLAGHVAEPHPIVGRARAFVSSSSAEGFPNALVEAMCLGRPIISTDCESGPAEILGRDGEQPVRTMTFARFGILVPTGDAAALTEALAHLSEEGRPAQWGRLALQRVADFELAGAVDAYAARLTGEAARGRRGS